LFQKVESKFTLSLTTRKFGILKASELFRFNMTTPYLTAKKIFTHTRSSTSGRLVRCHIYFVRNFSLSADGGSDKKNQLYLHIAPCGDYWSGHEVFAAKHLQPDYVKSIPWNLKVTPEDYLDDYKGDLDALLKKAYDTGSILGLVEDHADNKEY